MRAALWESIASTNRDGAQPATSATRFYTDAATATAVATPAVQQVVAVPPTQMQQPASCQEMERPGMASPWVRTALEQTVGPMMQQRSGDRTPKALSTRLVLQRLRQGLFDGPSVSLSWTAGRLEVWAMLR